MAAPPVASILELARLAATDPAAAQVAFDALPPEIRDAIAAEVAEVAPAPPRETFRNFIRRVRPGFKFWRYVEVAVETLQRVADGKTKYVIINWPPRYGKTLLVNLFTAYCASQYPDLWCGMASYGAELTHQSNAEARDYYMLGGGHVSFSEEGEQTKKRRRQSVRLWQTQGRGGVWAAGAMGPILGRGAHFLFLDDPVKNFADADSPTYRRKLVNWWQSTWTSREEPNVAWVIIMQRWHELDLVGWLFEQEQVDPVGWECLIFDEIRTLDPPLVVPASCTMAEDWRDEGEVLEPERFSEATVLRKRRTRGTRWWWAMNLQRPRPAEGTLFKREHFPTVPSEPSEVIARVRYWDLAGTEKSVAEDDPDYTVGLRASMTATGVMYVEDMRFGQWSVDRRAEEMKLAADADSAKYGGDHVVPIWWESDTGQGARERTRDLKTTLLGFDVHTEGAVHKKELRWETVIGHAASGNVRVVKDPTWNGAFYDFLTAINAGVKDQRDDVADALAGAYQRLAAIYRLGGMAGGEITTMPNKNPFDPQAEQQEAIEERRNIFLPEATDA